MCIPCICMLDSDLSVWHSLSVWSCGFNLPADWWQHSVACDCLISSWTELCMWCHVRWKLLSATSNLCVCMCVWVHACATDKERKNTDSSKLPHCQKSPPDVKICIWRAIRKHNWRTLQQCEVFHETSGSNWWNTSPCPPGDITVMPVEMRSRPLLTDRQTRRHVASRFPAADAQIHVDQQTGQRVCVCVGVLAWILGTLTSGQFTVWSCDTCRVNNRLFKLLWLMMKIHVWCVWCEIWSFYHHIFPHQYDFRYPAHPSVSIRWASSLMWMASCSVVALWYQLLNERFGNSRTETTTSCFPLSLSLMWEAVRDTRRPSSCLACWKSR